MKRDKMSVLASLALVGVIATACSSSSSSTQGVGGRPMAAGAAAKVPTSSIGASSLPGQSGMQVPVFPSYYDAHKDIVMVTDAYPKSTAAQYSPLWQTVNVLWKAGVTPVLLTSDNQIIALAKKGELTETVTPEIVNATVLTVGK